MPAPTLPPFTEPLERQHEDLKALDVASLFKGVQSTFKGPQDEGSTPKSAACTATIR
jgi:hypothetical protein